jgi:tRNA (cytidine/uridine-2'-O-)-methyltransferase
VNTVVSYTVLKIMKKQQFHIVLVEPLIPSNTGNLIRLAANIGAMLHLIHPLGFNLEDKNLRRAGLDYTDLADLQEHGSFQSYIDLYQERRLIFFTTRGQVQYNQINYSYNDSLIFGSEDSGLDPKLILQFPNGTTSFIPMQPHNRSMNLSNSVAVVAYEAWKQLGFDGQDSS